MRYLRSRSSVPVLQAIALAAIVSCGSSLIQKSCAAQDPPLRTETELVDQSMLDEGLAAAKAVKDLDEETLTAIQNIYDQASRDLKEMDRLAKEQVRFERLIQSTDEGSTKAEKQAQSEAPLLELEPLPADAGVDQFEAELRNLKARQKKLQTKKRELDAEPARRDARMEKLPEEVVEAESRLQSLAEQSDVPAIAGEPEALTYARELGLRAAGQMTQQKVHTLRLEQDAYLATADQLKTDLEQVTQNVKQLQKQIEELQTRVDNARQREIKDLAKETNAAEQALEKTDLEELKPFASLNVSLTEQLQTTVERVSEANEARTKAENAQQELQEDLDTAIQRVDSVKLSDAMGVMLRQDKAKLATLRKQFANVDTMEDTVLMRVEEYRLEDLKAEVEDPAKAAESAIKDLKVSAARATELREPLVKLLSSRKEMLTRLIELQGKLISALKKRETAELSFNNTSKQYTNFINEHILWIRSARPVGYGETKSWKQSIAWLTDVPHWQAVGQALTRSVSKHLPLSLPWLSLAVLMVCIHRPMSNGIFAAGLEAEKRACRNFTPTSTALVRTLIKSMMWPSLLYVAGKLILIGTENSSFCIAVGMALLQSALIIVPIELLRQTCRGKGLAEAHLEWHAHCCKAMKRDLDWFIPIAAILLLITLTLRNYGDEDWNGTLGRASMSILLVLSAVILYRMMRPGGLFFLRTTTGEGQSPWSSQLSYLRLVLLPGAPLVLLIFALAGYNYTAMELGKVWLQTIAVAIFMLVLYMVALRFFLVRRRRLRYEQLVEQREQARLLAENSNDQAAESPAKALPVELKTDSGMDITDVSKQARELTGVMFGLLAVVIFWNLWQELLPATRIFDDWQLWPTVTGENGEGKDWVTMRDVLISTLLFGLTFLGVRNIPGLLELVLLKQLPLDAGSRYAISTIVRYIITVAGVILALSFLKVPWAKYSWLVAAISVGLGFGLQEIVANFVSGLILLLERPVRVGDVVTIDGTTGIISRIQMRATTVTNWDNQELVVPNKDLITGKLMNWTLSSVINRIAIDVGVAYGTDPDQVQKILLRVAKENPDILNDPSPTVTFEEFGDSSLNFKLRCCITALSRRFLIIHAINTAIYKGLAEANIAIPFPQRDVNLGLPAGFEETIKKLAKDSD